MVTAISMMVFFHEAKAHEPEAWKPDPPKVLHLLEYDDKKNIVKTTHKDVSIFTPKNPYKVKISERLSAGLILRSSFKEEAKVSILLYDVVNGANVYIGYLEINGIDNIDKDTKEKFKYFGISLSKKHFDTAIVDITTHDGNQLDFYELHLHAKKQAEQGAADNPLPAE